MAANLKRAALEPVVKLSLVAMLLAAAAALAPMSARAQDGIMTDAFDPAMEAAREKAHRTLPHFLNVLKDRSATRTAVKVPVAHAEGRDHVWIENVRVEGDRFVGAVEEEPRPVTKLRKGAILGVTRAEISDWYYVRDGLTYGAWSMRALLDRFPKEEADRMRKLLAPE